jgi:ATP synthase protein I
MHKASTIQIKRIILVQFMATLAISTLLLVLDAVWFWSSITGGMISTLASAYFAWKVFAKQQQTTPEQILASYYSAEVGKVILTIMLFTAAILMIKPINIIALMGTYLFNQFTPWLVSFFIDDPDEVLGE